MTSAIILDMTGLSCPLPVMHTKRAVLDGARSLEIVVDSGTAKQNVSNLLVDSGFELDVRESAEGWTILATK